MTSQTSRAGKLKEERERQKEDDGINIRLRRPVTGGALFSIFPGIGGAHYLREEHPETASSMQDIGEGILEFGSDTLEFISDLNPLYLEEDLEKEKEILKIGQQHREFEYKRGELIENANDYLSDPENLETAYEAIDTIYQASEGLI